MLIKDEAIRAWIYRILTALLVVAVVFGIVSEEQAVSVGAVIAAIFGTTLAALNTSTKKEVSNDNQE
jgi:hypothetical protein